MRGVVLWAQTDAVNLGVAVLAEGTRRLAESTWPDIDLDTQYYADGPAPHTIAAPKLFVKDLLTRDTALRDWLRGYDVALDTRMGDSFADIYGVRRLRRLVAMGEFARHCDVPLALTPQTIGPFTTRQGRLLGSLSLRRADLVLCRDPVSAEIAADLGCRNPVVTTDVVFALETPPPLGSYDVLLNVSGLLWTSDSHGSSRAYRETITALVGALKAGGRDVTLLAHVLESPSPDNDVPVVRELGERWGLPVAVPTSLTEVRGMIRGARLLIGSRMHACLNALSVGTPAIALAYSRKFAPLMADIGWNAVIDLTDPDAGRLAAELAAETALADAVPETLARAATRLDAARAALRRIR